MGLMLGFQQTPAKLAHLMNLVSTKDDDKQRKAGEMIWQQE